MEQQQFEITKLKVENYVLKEDMKNLKILLVVLSILVLTAV